MKTISQKIKTVIAVTALVILFFCFVVTVISDTKREANTPNIELTDHWEMETKDGTFSDVSLLEKSFETLKRGDIIVITTTLPQQTITNPMMRLYTSHCSVEVFLDGDEIYEYGVERTLNNKFIGYGFLYFALPYDYSGKELTIRFISSESIDTKSLRAPTIYDSTTMMVNYAATNNRLLAMNMFLFVLGLGLVIFGIVLHLTKQRALRLASVGGFALSLSMWSMCSYHLMDIFTNDMLLKNYLEYYSLFLAPLFFLIYFWTDLKNRDTISIRATYKSLVVSQTLFLIVVTVAHFTDKLHISAAIWGQLALIIMEALGILAICLHDVIHKTFTSKALFLGIVSISFFALADVILFFFQKMGIETNKRHFSSITCMGGIVFVICLVWDYYLEHEKAKEEAIKTDALQRLAYTDPLTGIPNRRSYDDYLKVLEEKPEDFALVAVDVNGLKHINDTLGHEMGDLLITSMAECLRKTFGGGSMIARMGGDEFAAIVTDLQYKDMDSIIWKLQSEIELKNEEQPMLNISAAYGYCKRSEYPNMNAKEIYRIADSRMYVRKAQMKREGKH
ncbi:MAG: diguanylate cyclase [Lachnospiraceae bacterium]|nr:diguanylate cyclase [Lachnospiraceae bacterium]